MMKLHKFGNPNADIVLIQPVDDHDMEGIENEVFVIAESCGRDFFLVACQVEDWNKDLSPWKAHDLLKDRGVSCVLEWNEGNHFKEPDIRTAKAFAWLRRRSITVSSN